MDHFPWSKYTTRLCPRFLGQQLGLGLKEGYSIGLAILPTSMARDKTALNGEHHEFTEASQDDKRLQASLKSDKQPLATLQHPINRCGKSTSELTTEQGPTLPRPLCQLSPTSDKLHSSTSSRSVDAVPQSHKASQESDETASGKPSGTTAGRVKPSQPITTINNKVQQFPRGALSGRSLSAQQAAMVGALQSTPSPQAIE